MTGSGQGSFRPCQTYPEQVAAAQAGGMVTVPNVPCAHEEERRLTPPLRNSLPARARVRHTWHTGDDKPRWCDLSSTLFWLQRRGWPEMVIAGSAIVGEPAWRAWVQRAAVGPSGAEAFGRRDRVHRAACGRQVRPEFVQGFGRSARRRRVGRQRAVGLAQVPDLARRQRAFHRVSATATPLRR